MTVTTRMLIGTLALSLGLAGCGKDDGAGEDKDDKEPAGETGETGEDSAEDQASAGADKASHPAVAADSPLSAYDLAGVAEKWQGSWVRGGSSLGHTVAWHVDGADVTESDGETDKSLKLTIFAPCYLKAGDEDSGVSTYTTFAFDGDTLYAGLGSAGVVTGDGAVACVGGKIYELKGESCTEWKERFGSWESAEAACSLKNDVFEVDSRKLAVTGEALVDQQMKSNVAAKHPDLDAAKAALD